MITLISAKPDEIEISNKAIEEYLGYFGAKADETVYPVIEESKKEFLQIVEYKACITKTDVANENGCICLGFMKSESKSL